MLILLSILVTNLGIMVFFLRGNLHRIKDRAHVMILEEKQSKGTH